MPPLRRRTAPAAGLAFIATAIATLVAAPVGHAAAPRASHAGGLVAGGSVHSRWFTRRVVVKFRQHSTRTARAAAIASAGAREVHAPDPRHAIALLDPATTESGATGSGTSATLARLRRDPAVAWAEPEVRYRITDQAVQPEQAAVNLPTAVAAASTDGRAFDGHGTAVAVIDSGVDPNNPDLTGRVVDHGDYSTNAYSPTGGTTPSDPHGTAVAAVIAAADDTQGIKGTAPATQIWSYKVVTPDGYADSYAIYLAMEKADIDGADVINLSLGGPFDSEAVQAAALDAAHGHTDYPQYFPKEVTVVAAAGNDGGEQANYPAGDYGVLAVGATEFDATAGAWRLAPFSTKGSVDVVAPGVGITTWWAGQLAQVDGTSFSAPLVAGVAADLAGLGVHGDLTRTYLAAAAKPLSIAPGHRASEGYGQVDAAAAYQRAAANAAATAMFVYDGGSSLPNGYLDARQAELLRYDPDPTAAPNGMPTVVPSLKHAEANAYPDSYDRTEPAAGMMPGGGVLHEAAYFLVVGPQTVGADLAFTTKLTGEASTVRHTTIVAGDDGPTPARVQDRATYVAPLQWGRRSGLVRVIGAYGGDTVRVSFAMPDGVDLTAPDAPILAVWGPTDTSQDGKIELSTDSATSARWEPAGQYDLVYAGTATSGTVSFTAPVTGWYTVGVRLMPPISSAPTANGYYALRLTAPSTTATVNSPLWANNPNWVLKWAPTGTHAARATNTQVQYARRYRTKSGRWTHTAWRLFTEGSAKGSMPFGSSYPRTSPGTYLFRARTADNAGNFGLWSRVANGTLPLDDDAAVLHYTGNWAYTACPYRSMTACFGRSFHENNWIVPSTYTMTTRVQTRRFAVISDRCPKCAGFTVYIDGVSKGFHSAYGTTAHHQILWQSRSLGTRPHWHRLTLVWHTSSTRPRVILDGLGVQR